MVLQEAKSSRVLTKAFPVNNAKENSRVLKSQLKKGHSPIACRKLVEVGPQVRKPTTCRNLSSKHQSKKTAPPSRRTVAKLPISMTEGIGKRAQSQKLTFLEQRSISAEVLGQYGQYQQKFWSFCQDSGLGWPKEGDMDAILADFLDVMFLDGRSAAEGEKVVAAIEFNHIGLRGSLVRCRRALRGWRKERPLQSRLPLPRLIACGMAMAMASEGRKLMALKLMVDHDTYLRPGESIDLKGKDVIPPVRHTGRQYQWHSLLIRDIEDRKPDKVGVYDNSIPLNSPGREYLGDLLMRRVRHLNSTAADFRKVFQKAGERLGLNNLHPYQTRHGGASEDLNSGERDHQGVKIRGRWHTDQSVRRYGKVGKIQRLMANLSPAHMAYCQWSLRNIERVLKGTLAARPP